MTRAAEDTLGWKEQAMHVFDATSCLVKMSLC